MKSTVEFKGVEFDVEYYYHPGEPQIRYFADGSGQQGEPAYVEITSIGFKGADFTEILERDVEEIEELIFEQLID